MERTTPNPRSAIAASVGAAAEPRPVRQIALARARTSRNLSPNPPKDGV